MENYFPDTMQLKGIYEFAKDFLLRELKRPDAEKIIENYLSIPDKSSTPVSIQKVFRGLLGSAQNANMTAGVIGGSLAGGVDSLGKVLFGFDPSKVVAAYGGDAEKILDEIIATLNPRGQIRRTPRSIWPKYARTILSAAAFLSQFKNGKDFNEWANHFYADSRSQAALPLVLGTEIEGIGYPLACDFLKELGYIDYGKPDVNIMDIFVGIGLCQDRASPYQFQKVISRIADGAGVSAYAVDKLFWLIGSGRFYSHPELKGFGRKKAKFIAKFNGTHLLAQAGAD